MSNQGSTYRLAGAGIAILALACLLAAAPRPLLAGEAAGTGSAAHQRTAEAPVAAHGVVITWNAAAQRFESPEPAQAADLARELRSLLSGEIGQHAGLADKSVVEVLPNGLARARIPAGLLSLSVVRPAGNGTFAPVCSQGPDGALRALAAPVVDAAPAER